MAAAWVLVAWAHQIRAELVDLAPNRDKASDGSIGDQAHQDSKSGHNPDESGNAERRDADSINEVRAIDIDKDLRVPGLTMAMVIAFLVGRCRAGLERRLIYIIFDRVIWSASSGWQARRYTGSNAHTEHGHLSGDPDGDNDRRPFGLAVLKGAMGVSAEDVTKALEEKRPFQSAGVGRLAKSLNMDPQSARWFLESTWEGQHKQGLALATLLTNFSKLLGADFTNEQQIIDGVLAGFGTKPAREVAAALVAAGQDPTELAAALTALAARPA